MFGHHSRQLGLKDRIFVLHWGYQSNGSLSFICNFAKDWYRETIGPYQGCPGRRRAGAIANVLPGQF